MRHLVPVSLVLAACGGSPPEIWIDVAPVDVGAHIEGGEPRPFGIQLANRGGEDLRILDVALFQDGRCAFTLEGPDRELLAPGDDAFLRGTYTPEAPGRDTAALLIVSDAENLPEMWVALCGRTLADGEEPPDEACELPPADDPTCADR